MKKTLGFFFLVMILVTACTPSPTTKPSAPKAGHWVGSDPSIYFDVTEEGEIVNFKMSVLYGASTCSISIESAAVQPDFSITLDFTGPETLSAGYIVGEFHRTVISGKYLVRMCRGTMSFGGGEDEERDWSAEWQGKITTTEPAGSAQGNDPAEAEPTESAQANDPTEEPNGISETYTIEAQESTWFDTGIFVHEADGIIMDASGVIDFGGVLSGPGGNPDVQTIGYGVVPTAPCGTLVAMIGSGDPFVVGDHYQELAQSEGTLKLLINDTAEQYSDNSGQFQVTITIR